MDSSIFSSSSPLSSRNNSHSSETLHSAAQDCSTFNNPFQYLGVDKLRGLITRPMEHHGHQDVSAALGEVLGGLERVAEHLRVQGANAAANEVAKSTIAILNTFNFATADWTAENYRMLVPRPTQDVRVWNDGIASPKMTEAAPRAGGSYERTLVTTQKAADLETQANTIETGSWAAVAASATDVNNRIVKFRPSDGRTCHVTDKPGTVVASESPGPDNNRRVIWIRPWNQQRRPLSDITEKIVHGPIFSIKYSAADEGVCVIFQHATSARLFLEANTQSKELRGEGLFGSLCEVIEGDAYPVDQDLLRMETKMERRRLTFARKGLFTNGVTEAKFKKEIFKIVGESNVERVWLFNGGNATVVLMSTIIARTVREVFIRKSISPGLYQAVVVTFSHDPCERPLHLTSQISGSHREFASRASYVDGPPGHAHAHAHPARNSFVKPAPARARPGPAVNSGNNRFKVLADSNEWQLIAKRK